MSRARRWCHCLLLAAALLLGRTVPALADSCRKVAPHTPSDAENAFLHANYDQAETLYRQALAAKPNDPILTAGLVRALLRQQKVSDAAATLNTALAAAPKSSVLLTSLAEVQYRQGLVSESDQSSVSAYNADLCYARAHLMRARIARLNSMYGYEQREISMAHALDPYDPDIRSEWIGTLSLTQRIEELKKYLSEPTGDNEEDHRDTQMYLDQLEKRSAEPQRRCRLVSSSSSTEIPLESILFDDGHVRSWALMVKFNNKAAKLEVDTGAGGLYISRAVAERAGLQAVARTQSYGIGDRGPQSGFTAYVDGIRIGNLEFQNCLVEVSDRKNIMDSDGLIGMDIFSDFLVSLDYPSHKLGLSPLPPREDELAAPKTLRTDASDQGHPSDDLADAPAGGDSEPGDSKAPDAVKLQARNLPKDRYIAPEMKNWTPIFRIGHTLIIPATINKKTTKLFIIDTAAQFTTVSKAAASEITRVYDSPNVIVRGISGEVKHVYTAGTFTLQFADKIQDTRDAIVLDTSGFSRNLGIEISGFIGSSALKFLTIRVDYRDGLVKFDYDPRRNPVQ